MPIIEKGDKYNRLTAVKFSHKNNKRPYWLFKCECGKEKIICVSNVKNSHTKSCGCLQTEVRKKNREKSVKHKMCGTRTYKSWGKMKERCLDKKHLHYKNYGGRGIKICDRWLGKKGFENFYEDMGERPKNKSLDRIDNNLGYFKENCKWSSPKEQSNNRRNSCFITYNYKTKTMNQWAKMLGMSREVIFWRINKGWSIEKTLESSVRKKRNN